MFLTTGLFNLFADHADVDLPKLRHVLFGGDVGSAVHARRFLNRHPGCKLTNAYGPTETTVFATAFEVPPNFSGQELPIGKVIAHTGIAILDEALREVPHGIEGQLAISGDGLAIGYFKRPELTAEKFVTVSTNGGQKRYYLTGDLAILETDGTVAFKGRRDRQIKINGKRIELDEIEATLRRDPRLADGIVLCHVQSPTLKRIVAYLCPRQGIAGAGPDFVPSVMAALRAALPAYMIPSAAVVVDAFPLTPAPVRSIAPSFCRHRWGLSRLRLTLSPRARRSTSGIALAGRAGRRKNRSRQKLLRPRRNIPSAHADTRRP